ncbi:MAG: Hsp70 family protein, partial [Chloroflexi bacterium]|nr:Hsp70 family protein [Chloroflexota bacterium]
SGLILRKVKADAEAHLGERIERAVVTVPAYFNDRQRQATKQAAAQAGIELLRVLNEPTAAALAYGLQREDAHTVLVWDLGGGTFDVSILELGDGIFEVRAVSGDTWLGGDDFDARVMAYLAAEYEKVCGVAYPADAVARYELKRLAEHAKIELSSVPVARVHLPGPDPHGSPSVAVVLHRERLEAITHDLVQRMVPPTRQALQDAGLTPKDLDRVILVGGATRMPAVRRLARSLLGQEPYRSLDPDEVVALGAAVQAGMLLGLAEKVVLLDVLPLSLGVETQGGLTGKVISRNTPLPAAASRIFTTARDYQTTMDIHVVQGEREMAADNISLGQFKLEGVPPAAKGIAKVEVTFEADVDGIVRALAQDLLTENEVSVQVTSAKFLDREEVDRLAQEAQARAQEDRSKRERVQAQIEAENLIAAARAALSRLSGQGAAVRAGSLEQAVVKAQAALADATVEDIRRCSQELRGLLAAAASEGRRAGTPERGA